MKRGLLAGIVLVSAALGAWLFLHQASSSATNTAAPAPSAPAAESLSSSAATDGADTLAALINDGLRAPSPLEREHASHVLLPRLVRLDPADAVRLVESRERGPARDELLGRVAHAWADADLAGALAWLVTLSDADDRSIAATATLALLSPEDPAGALEIGRWLDEGIDNGRLEYTLQLWTEQHPEEAIAWVQAQPAGPWRDRLLSRVAHVRTQQDPPAALALASTGLSAGAARDDAFVNIARQWSWRDPAAAAAWIESLPAGSLQNRARVELARATEAR